MTKTQLLKEYKAYLEDHDPNNEFCLNHDTIETHLDNRIQSRILIQVTSRSGDPKPMTLSCPIMGSGFPPRQTDEYIRALQEQYPDYAISSHDILGVVTFEDHFLYTDLNDLHARVLKLTTMIRRATDYGIDHFPDYFGDILNIMKMFK